MRTIRWLMPVIGAFLFSGCFSLMGEKDWARFDQIAADRGWTQEQKAVFKEELLKRDEDTRAVLAKEVSDVADTIIDAIPGPAPRKPMKDLADWGIYALLGLAGAGVGVKSIKNSAPGKMFGHPFHGPPKP